MLAMTDKDGQVPASIPGLAALARVSIEKCEEAIDVLSSPDKYSRTVEFDGRRIEKIDGGWRLLNHGKYRKMLSAEERREYLATKQREYRSRKQPSTPVNNVSDTDTRLTHTDSDTDSKADTNTEKEQMQRALFEKFWIDYPKKLDKELAFREWTGLSPMDWDRAVESVGLWAKSPEWDEPRFIPAPVSFIKKRRWESVPVQKAKKKSLLEQQKELEAKHGIS